MPCQLSFAKFTVETCHRKLKNISSKQLPCNMNGCLSAIIYAKTSFLKAFSVKKKHENLSDGDSKNCC